jgi:Zn-dependent dipeptidase, microsomal dipeptidase homolog
LRNLTLLLLSAACLTAQPQLTGVVDIHVHCDPDSTPRSIDAIDLARLAKSKGMRALVLKNHYEPTASLAYVVRKVVPGIEIFGGIDLNRTVGGVSAAAVERMVMTKGGWGRVIWMPTFDAENQVRVSKQNRPFVAVSKRPAASGSKRSDRAGRQTPIDVGDRPLFARGGADDYRRGAAPGRPAHCGDACHDPAGRNDGAQMRAAAKQGAYIEFVYNGLIGPNKEFQINDYAKAIREIGPEHCILSSDLGQAGNPLHPDGLVSFFAGLAKEGFAAADIELMSRTNPARALGLQ